MLYIKEYIKQEIKHNMRNCGDTTLYFRYRNKSYFAIFDGIGSGTYANIISNTLAVRFKEKILRNFSFSKVCEDLVDYIDTTEPKESLYTAFTAVYIYNNNAQVFVYDAPNPIVQRGGVASLLKLKEEENEHSKYKIGKTILEEGDRLIIFSDGLSEAGNEIDISGGIGSKGLLTKYNSLKNKYNAIELMDNIFEYCKEISLGKYRDDSSMIILEAEKANILNIFTGPPSAMKLDNDFANDFLHAEGTKVICGSTTSDIIARELNVKLIKKESSNTSYANPPRYEMEYADLVTEGAVCLNQTYNLLSSTVNIDSNETSPEELARLILQHDVIYFFIGKAENNAHKAIVFKQLGIEERHIIIQKLEKLLGTMDKTILWKYY